MNVNLEDYITSANECFELNLTRPSKDAAPEPIFSESFNPAWTYPFFGEEQEIIGHKEPSIQLSFRANDMKPSLQVGFEEKVELPDEVYSEKHLKVDLETVFEEYLPASVFNPADAPADSAQTDPTSKDWRPPGKQLHSFAHHGKQFEIWVASFTDPNAKRLWENMQILPMLYIEGASLPELDAEWSLERWSLYLLYEVTPIDEETSPYTLAGFSTTYRFWLLPTFEIMRATRSLPSPPASTNGHAGKWSPPRLTQDPDTFRINETIDPLKQPSRERISQFLILPPYQGQSLGAILYEAIFGELVKRPYIYEIPVEDPSEAFDAMRDYSDIVYLRTLPSFQSLTIPATIPKEKLAKGVPIPRAEILGNGVDLSQLQRETKIVSRQFNRMLELHLLSTIPPANRNKNRIIRKDRSSNENDRRYYFWRLALKDRIHRQNRDSLENMEEGEEALTTAQKVEMIENAVNNQQAEYEERLQGLETRAKWRNGEVQVGSGSRSKRKRMVIEDDEDDEWEDMDNESATSKKARV
ncbi:histone acetyltransferase 1 [Didymosphaeria variabile]|uniref:Histone acetyltransferase type B catalytic subunit n=1 Tax=Didymosphaeria variabile TaxID=1932322 RepID=A0A9W8XQN1_9PLEO|nr:histone acetyltransferase 1 [Didymosphaeria variabile]KAJ4355791.1 histone acetyltransferase 1 [Didymosphaeria variabile]